MTKTDRVAWEIRMWWNERIVDGRQLEHLGEFIAGWDYRGAGWMPLVSIQALYVDFAAWHDGEYPELTTFMRAWRKATNEDNFIRCPMLKPTDKGMRLRVGRLCVRFGKQPLTPLPI